jgi:Ni,Fe-hydrogenase III large subunit
MTEKIGPVQLVAIGFPQEAEFEGRITAELERLESHETIRVLDLLFVSKDAETGDLLALD